MEILSKIEYLILCFLLMARILVCNIKIFLDWKN
uniref:Uncharacterized protein n=1 Tax=virus sp. ctkyY8 TaxID=2827995 RepID=A0A8S5RDV6_9VIRU|nr:MAG TPA: hypothetical protein [virus sp. ctkyY8]